MMRELIDTCCSANGLRKMAGCLVCVCLAVVVCSCAETRSFLSDSDDDLGLGSLNSYKRHYTEGFLDMMVVKKEGLFPSYSIESCSYTKSDLSAMVLPKNSTFSSDDTVKVLGRDGEELGTYMIHFIAEGDTSDLGIVMQDGKFKRTSSVARLVVPYNIQARYLKIGKRRIEIPD